MLREIAPSIAIRDRDLAKHRADREIANGASRAVDREIALVLLGFVSVFLGFASSFFFSKHQKIFSENFFEMQPNT